MNKAIDSAASIDNKTQTNTAATPANPMIELIKNRRSLNHFDPDHTMSEQEIARLVALATQAPTAFNGQNWHFIAVHSDTQKATLQQMAFDQAKVSEASVSFIIVGRLDIHRSLAESLQPSIANGTLPQQVADVWQGMADGMYGDNPTMQRDEAMRTGSLAAMTLMMAAESMGYGSCPMIGFDAEAIQQTFNLSAEEVPVMLVTVGREVAGNWQKKQRRPVSEVLTLV
ncbi:Putative NAD(P)H nitroreductase YodC [Sinobacterium norvegicum]|uniref:NAD(P)H nitroreductase YodC n=1 Tax=Sinobacterium norvegicum TaxID=1641715 RepID=A0ABM9AFR1_9GAMM|nr:nitroreductase family protein [Sinobacterium norvegicum]CAH0992044.1 Putative NAD(P)H nitroreductase YodC [Sinobacterium norvegicum]